MNPTKQQIKFVKSKIKELTKRIESHAINDILKAYNSGVINESSQLNEENYLLATMLVKNASDEEIKLGSSYSQKEFSNLIKFI